MGNPCDVVAPTEITRKVHQAPCYSTIFRLTGSSHIRLLQCMYLQSLSMSQAVSHFAIFAQKFVTTPIVTSNQQCSTSLQVSIRSRLLQDVTLTRQPSPKSLVVFIIHPQHCYVLWMTFLKFLTSANVTSQLTTSTCLACSDFIHVREIPVTTASKLRLTLNNDLLTLQHKTMFPYNMHHSCALRYKGCCVHSKMSQAILHSHEFQCNILLHQEQVGLHT